MALFGSVGLYEFLLVFFLRILYLPDILVEIANFSYSPRI